MNSIQLDTRQAFKSSYLLLPILANQFCPQRNKQHINALSISMSSSQTLKTSVSVWKTTRAIVMLKFVHKHILVGQNNSWSFIFRVKINGNTLKSFSGKPSPHYQWKTELKHSLHSPLMKLPKCDADRTPCEQIQAHNEGLWITAISMNNPSITHVSSLVTNLHNLVTNALKNRHPIELWNCFSLITGFHSTKKIS
jgi:hypothetical protein